jgi:hypothetical protein
MCIIGMTKSRIMRRNLVVYVGEKLNMQIKSRAKPLTEIHRLGDIGVDESVILKFIIRVWLHLFELLSNGEIV